MRQATCLLSFFPSWLRAMQRRLARCLDPSEAPASASATRQADSPASGPKDIMSTLTIDRPIHLVRYPHAGLQPIVLDSGLVASAAGSVCGAGAGFVTPGAEATAVLEEDPRALAALRARMSVNHLLLRRLVGLWNTVVLAGCDEIGDGSVQAEVDVTSSLLPMALQVRAIGVTVFADGLCSFSVVIEGVDTPLWLSEQLDLAAVVDANHGG